MKKLKITLKRSPISSIPKHRATVKALGLRRLGAATEKNATPAILGMVRSVAYLVEVEEIN
jgi:large subunit ribosomal protein L30